MEGKVVEAVLAGKNNSFSEDMVEEKDGMAAAAARAAIFAFLVHPLSLLRHVVCLCAGYLGLDGGLKPVPAPASSSSAAAAVSQIDEVDAAASEEDCTAEVVVLEVRSRGRRQVARSLDQSKDAEVGGKHY